jgi:5-hydroxyisourate hydrolase-like protein (transthyretin family)
VLLGAPGARLQIRLPSVHSAFGSRERVGVSPEGTHRTHRTRMHDRTRTNGTYSLSREVTSYQRRLAAPAATSPFGPT